MNAHIAKTDSIIDYVIDDGTKVIPIKNKYGDVLAKVKFRTTDMNIVERAEKAENSINEVLSGLKSMSINPDGTTSDPENMKILKEAKEKLTEQINGIFGDDVCTELFRKCSPFSPVSGRFFADIVVETLVKIIDNEMTAEQEKIIGEYTSDVR